MKVYKTALAAVLLLSALALSGCAAVKMIPPGYVSSAYYRDPDSFRDYSEYGKYIYDPGSVSFSSNANFYEVYTESEMDVIAGYIDDFAGWMEASGRSDEFDFDKSQISLGDHYRLETKGGIYSDYRLWYFDADSSTLYYFANNT